MKNKLMIGIWAGVYVVATSAIVYIYKKGEDAWTAYLDECKEIRSMCENDNPDKDSEE